MPKPRDHLVQGTLHKLVGILIKSASPVLTILLAHFFSQDTFGQYVSLQLLALTLSRFCLLGLDKGIVWYLPQNVRESREPFHQLGAAFAATLRTALWLTLGALIVLAVLLNWGPRGLGSVSPVFAVLCLAAVPPLVVTHYFGAALEGVYQPKYRVWIGEFSLYASVPPVALALRAAGVGGTALPLAFLIAALGSAAMMFFVARRHFNARAVLPRGRLDSALGRYSWPQGVSDLISSVMLRIDLWLVLYFLGPSLAAVYAVMLTLSNAVKTIRQSFDSLLLPVISGMSRETQREKLRPAFGFTVGIVTIIQYFIALAVFFFPGEILSIAGRGYSVEPRTLLLLLLGNLVGGFFGLNAQVLSGLGKSALLMRLNLAVLAMNFVLDLWWIPLFGLEGAAAATVVALMIQNALLFALQRGSSGIRLYSRMLWIQFGLILVFGAGAFALFPLLENTALLPRTGGFAVTAAAYAAFAFRLRRSTALKPGF